MKRLGYDRKAIGTHPPYSTQQKTDCHSSESNSPLSLAAVGFLWGYCAVTHGFSVGIFLVDDGQGSLWVLNEVAPLFSLTIRDFFFFFLTNIRLIVISRQIVMANVFGWTQKLQLAFSLRRFGKGWVNIKPRCFTLWCSDWYLGKVTKLTSPVVSGKPDMIWPRRHVAFSFQNWSLLSDHKQNTWQDEVEGEMLYKILA